MNPLHLRLRSNVENARDNGQGSKTRCPVGHPYSGGNLILDGRGHRRCKACRDSRNANRLTAVDPEVAWAEYELWCDTALEDILWNEFGRRSDAVAH
jgi:hypothetical protein